uniref:Neural cell adhesion molecule 3 n=1 Tax=Tetraodon nigroviridis TaxID=99883 RepID=H3DP36_TETNG
HLGEGEVIFTPFCQGYKVDAKMALIPTTQDFPVGQNILLFCKAGGEGDITWRKNGMDVDDDKVTKIDETSSKLIIENAALEDSGTYTCHCDFENGHVDSIETELHIYMGPWFGQTKTYHEFLEGTEGRVPCLVTGQPEVDVLWLRDQKPVSSEVGGHLRQLPDNTLIIQKVKREDAGMYSCQGKIKDRPVFNTLNVSVVVNVPPTVYLKEEEKKVLASPETNVSLLCLVDGIPKPNITWNVELDAKTLRPTTIDSSHHQFNSDRSQLIIKSVTKSDYGEYTCTAINKIAESSATMKLHVFEALGVFVSAEQQIVSVGERVSVSCNVSGHPEPELHWINKHNGRRVVGRQSQNNITNPSPVHQVTQDATSGHAYVSEGVLVIEDMVPSDGGLYSCMAVGAIGNASRDVAIYSKAQPPSLSKEKYFQMKQLTLKTMPLDGGTAITSFVLQWKQDGDNHWEGISIPVSDPLVITNLKQYTSYTVRLAASNAVGVGHFSENKPVRTMGIREPDVPILSPIGMKVEGNTFYIPLQHVEQGASPLQHFTLRYREDKDGAEWKEMELSPSADSISLQDLSFGSDYEVEVKAVNFNGSSIPATFNFTIGQQPCKRPRCIKVSSSMTKGTVVGIVIVIFLVVFLIVDATCCYKNHCGMLMSIAVKLFGQNVPGMKAIDEE